METAIKIIGIIFISMAVWLFIDVKMHRKSLSFFITGSRIYIIAAIRIALGLMFILGAEDCRRTMIISIIGIVALVLGIAIFAMGLEKAHAVIHWVQARSDIFLRFDCVLLFALGVLTIYAA